ncbi:immunoglobulin super DCC subclass member [Perkinsus chesapeaki]|uniref:Immunoglobulin super DCC subclass member n=1 Tax=Perkinsus chesapeaki TaxID=330153 RepID=A0A7J6LZ49_PERCH|nr:immunoglobulin super DCC subclass member [Perkinsus chesapeaki]
MNNPSDIETGENAGGGLEKVDSTSTASKGATDNGDFVIEDASSPKDVMLDKTEDDITPKPEDAPKKSKCDKFNYWLCMIFCCRPPHEMTDDERAEWEKKSFWDKYKDSIFCFIRYFIMFIIGIGVGIGIFFLVLYCMGIIGGTNDNNNTSNNTIDLGELEYPRVVAGYSNLTITISPVASALTYDPKDYLIETQVASSTSSGSRRLRSDGPWTVALEIPYNKNEASTGTITGLTAGEQLLIRYKIEMEDGRTSSPSVAVMENTKTPTAPSVPGLMAYNTSSSSVSVTIIPPTHNNGADITGYVIQHAATSDNNTTTGEWSKAEISQDDAAKPYTVDGLSSGDLVMFKISAENSAGSSDYSKPYSMITDNADADKPDQVTGFAANSTTSNSVTLSWTAPSNNGAMILNYIISMDVNGLNRGSDYTFYITARNSKGYGPKSDALSTKTTESCEADQASNVMRQTPFSDGLSVSWSSPTNPQCDLPITGYRVIDDDNKELCQPSTNGALWCDITGLQPSTSYTIRVQSKNDAGWSNKITSPVKMSTIASGKCNNRDSVRWWVSTSNPTYSGEEFTSQIETCSVQGLGNPNKVSSCLVDYTKDPSKTPFNLDPISDDCGMCYGANAKCSMAHCSFPCGMGTADSSPACLQCNDQYCKPDFYTCSGLYASIGPPDPQ